MMVVYGDRVMRTIRFWNNFRRVLIQIGFFGTSTALGARSEHEY
jgi:hypothetical protein